jgi:hypothetical protein
MTQYYPGPYEVELFYVEGSITHVQRLNCNIVAEGVVGDPFANFSVATKAGASLALSIAVSDYVAVARTLMAPTANFTVANLYKYTPESYDKAFLATNDINLVGTGAGTVQLNHQTMWTFTTQLGNNMRLTLLDDISTSNARIPIRDGTVAQQNMATYVLGNTSWILARDGSYGAGRLNVVGGQNEALFKRRNR